MKWLKSITNLYCLMISTGQEFWSVLSGSFWLTVSPEDTVIVLAGLVGVLGCLTGAEGSPSKMVHSHGWQVCASS